METPSPAATSRQHAGNHELGRAEGEGGEEQGKERERHEWGCSAEAIPGKAETGCPSGIAMKEAGGSGEKPRTGLVPQPSLMWIQALDFLQIEAAGFSWRPALSP